MCECLYYRALLSLRCDILFFSLDLRILNFAKFFGLAYTMIYVLYDEKINFPFAYIECFDKRSR